jgi:hypothetical protein
MIDLLFRNDVCKARSIPIETCKVILKCQRQTTLTIPGIVQNNSGNCEGSRACALCALRKSGIFFLEKDVTIAQVVNFLKQGVHNDG